MVPINELCHDLQENLFTKLKLDNVTVSSGGLKRYHVDCGPLLTTLSDSPTSSSPWWKAWLSLQYKVALVRTSSWQPAAKPIYLSR